MAICISCSKYAKFNKEPEPVFEDSEINPVTGLCWNVCDMEAEVEAIEQAAYDALGEEYY